MEAKAMPVHQDPLRASAAVGRKVIGVTGALGKVGTS